MAGYPEPAISEAVLHRPQPTVRWTPDGRLLGRFDATMPTWIDTVSEWGYHRQLSHWRAWRAGDGEQALPILEIVRITVHPWINQAIVVDGVAVSVADYNPAVSVQLLSDLARYSPARGIMCSAWLASCARFYRSQLTRPWRWKARRAEVLAPRGAQLRWGRTGGKR